MNDKTGNGRLLGLDSIRFICACWVFFFHSGFLMGRTVLSDGSVANLRSIPVTIVTNFFAGPAAVIVFFLISGLVVHYPNLGKKVDLYCYFTRRFIRVGGPIVVLAIALPFLTNDMTINDLPVWSLWCELVYYALYPAILLAKRRFGLPVIILFAFVAALLLAVAPGTDQGAFVARGVWLTWILGLPTWLLGMLVAEYINSGRIAQIVTWRRLHIWVMRGCIVFLGATATILRFHTPISEQISLLLFAIPAAVWLFAEVNFATRHPPRAWLERQGSWSYSLYLVHLIAVEMIIYVVPSHYFGASPITVWLACLALGFCLAQVFFLMVEQPFHRLARLVSLLRPRSKNGLGSVVA